MKFSIFPTITTIGVLGTGIFFTKSYLMETRKVPLALACNDPKIGTLSWKNRAKAHEDQVRSKKILESPEILAMEQVKFIRGQLHFGFYKGHLTPVNNPRIKILSQEWKNYDQSFTHSLEDKPRLVNIKDKALEVTYHVEQDVLICDEDDLKELEISLPLDPYLAYWTFPQDNWVKHSFNGKSAYAPRCSFSQVIELPPWMFWYVWSPTETGIKKDGSPYQCAEELKTQLNTTHLQASLNSKKSNSSELSFDDFQKKQNLKMSYVIGFINELPLIEAMNETKHLLAFLPNHFALKDSHPKGINWRKEPSVAALFLFVATLRNQFLLSNLEIEQKEDHFLIRFLAQSKNDNKRSISIHVYLGATVARQKIKGADLFWKTALENDDLVFYLGHADIGRVLSLNPSLTKTGPSHQVIGLFACYATSYWEMSNTIRHSRTGLKTDLLLMGFEGYALGHAGDFLIMLDELITNRNTKAFDSYLKRQRLFQIVRWEREIN